MNMIVFALNVLRVT